MIRRRIYPKILKKNGGSCRPLTSAFLRAKRAACDDSAACLQSQPQAAASA